jgi:hypothetical protein
LQQVIEPDFRSRDSSARARSICRTTIAIAHGDRDRHACDRTTASVAARAAIDARAL